ncbi:hypothetical protein LINPERPRIM_LOCUS2110 [Linum perenne]
MGPDKAPGLNGFNPGFYQSFWGLIGKEVAKTVGLGCPWRSFQSKFTTPTSFYHPRRIILFP